jgi:hypothetical protein
MEFFMTGREVGKGQNPSEVQITNLFTSPTNLRGGPSPEVNDYWYKSSERLKRERHKSIPISVLEGG